LTANDIIILQKNNILWGSELKYDMWEETDEDKEIEEKLANINGRVERINVVTKEPINPIEKKKEPIATTSA
jgi:hypothetical protein